MPPFSLNEDEVVEGVKCWKVECPLLYIASGNCNCNSSYQ